MDNFEELVQIVTQKVLEALGKESGIYQDTSNRLGVYGEKTADLAQFFKDTDYSGDKLDGSSQGVVVSQLSLESLMRISEMLPSTEGEKHIFEALMTKKKVYVLNSGKEYTSLMKKSPYSAKAHVLKAENQWEKYGAEFINVKANVSKNKTTSRVWTKELLQKEMNQGITEWTVTESTIVTPLAKDFIREKQLKLNYVREEE
ncbi:MULTISPECIES: hypothetical protein [Vagococcus]|uniref:Uncharacterized protein n=1 Tax=Vagococcus fluvialis bH819 TaxID=1255619 RepID=A0A1X6WPH0_9ENTE|nr:MULTISPECIES: hypothetical protein [Vagococcus]SLM86214.1 hypothetical protein FM121_09000 [Vagococcus fluvialis bH819]HCM89694.1 hypothetical protein [Vagococcus sp.]